MSTIREPAVAGMFYPEQADELAGDVDALLAEAARRQRASETVPKALIVPHAGYIYSGPIAASAYAQLHGADIRRVVLLGPSHRVGFLGLASSSAERFRTPLGEIPLDRESIEAIEALPQVHRLDQAHQMEHSLEVQLPFLQRLLGDFQLVPLVVGDAEADEVAEVLQGLWGGPETLIVISSDLSHYHPYASAQDIDRATCEAIVQRRPEAIGFEDACGRNPIKGLLRLAQKKGLEVTLLDLRNSGDTAGDKARVVGYGAFALTEGEPSHVFH